MSKHVVNKYGKSVDLPGTKNSGLVPKIIKILEQANATYCTEFTFDVTGERRSPFDIAVFRDNESTPAFLVEYDGPTHYDSTFYELLGNRPERNPMHVVRQQLSDAKKAQIAVKHGVPLLRVTDVYRPCLRDLILCWVWTFVDQQSDSNSEINGVKMLSKYGFDFSYVAPSSPSKREQEFLEKWKQDSQAEKKSS